MEKIFIYGTILDEEIKKQVLGRVIKGKWALVDNFILIRDWEVGGKAYPRLYPHSAGCVIGEIIEVTDDEIKLLDEYETNAYKRDFVHVKNEGNIQTYFANKKGF